MRKEYSNFHIINICKISKFLLALINATSKRLIFYLHKMLAKERTVPQIFYV